MPPQNNSDANPGQPSESFRTLPQGSESFRSIPNSSEAFRNVPKDSERKEYCTLTVREVARMFEAAGVARTERSIVNWCQPNKTGVSRLDNYFDPNDRKYFISPQSVELAIEEEKAKAAKAPDSSEPVGSLPNDSESRQGTHQVSTEGDANRIRELEKEVMDLKITNRGKDYFIEQMQKERQDVTEKLMTSHRRVGELETRLLQLEGPKAG